MILRVLTRQVMDTVPWDGAFSGFPYTFTQSYSDMRASKTGLNVRSGWALRCLTTCLLTLWSVSGYVHPPFCCSCEYSDHHVHEHRTPVDSWCVGSQRLQVIPGHCASSLIQRRRAQKLITPQGHASFKTKIALNVERRQ